MSAAFLLMVAAQNRARQEEEERKEKERLEQLAQQTAQEKISYLATRALSWKSNKDIANAYLDVLYQRMTFDSMHNSQPHEISIRDFFAFLTQYKERKNAIHLIKEQKLFEITLDKTPWLLSSFIRATSWRKSVIGSGKDGYAVEVDIAKNRQKIFQYFCPEQRKPKCPQKQDINFGYPSLYLFLECLQEYTRPELRNALAQDIVIPATIMASGKKDLEKLYRRFLEKKTILYSPDKKTIAKTFEEARKAAQTPEYQNLFIAPCPAIKTKRLWGIFPVSSIDESQHYECPIMKKILERQNSR